LYEELFVKFSITSCLELIMSSLECEVSFNELVFRGSTTSKIACEGILNLARKRAYVYQKRVYSFYSNVKIQK
ncbi:MAG TPA: hypothetical protein VEH06_07950, partial [Candidatus Bathyarchaeia archaeon]|nr:hypothetical protein [Candidatus Bathyarchaeia archaeon]